LSSGSAETQAAVAIGDDMVGGGADFPAALMDQPVVISAEEKGIAKVAATSS